MKVPFSTLLILLLLLTGLTLLLYPGVSNWWNGLHQSQAIVAWEDALTQLEETDYASLFAAAQDYNEKLKQLDFR